MKALETARRKGHEARRNGESREACPYRDTRNEMNQVTFSRAFRRAWFEGYEQREKEEQTMEKYRIYLFQPTNDRPDYCVISALQPEFVEQENAPDELIESRAIEGCAMSMPCDRPLRHEL